MLQPQTILNRICECINDLGLVLDQLYKFPQKQRETYFDRIQSMKNKLLLLKTNFRESSLATTEKQYKQIYLAMNTLKSDIQQQTALIPVYKENRESNRFKEIKDVKKNYEEAMKLLVSKDDEIAELKNLLFQKQQLVHLNLQQLNNLKHERQRLVQVGRLGKYEQNSVEIEYEAIKAALLRAQSQVMEFRKREEEKDKAFSSAIVELEELKGDLIATKEKLNYYEQMAQFNLAKTIRAQENIKKAQKEVYGLDENYKLKQYSNIKKLREAGELELELKGKAQLLRQLELQNKRLNQDLQVMENQLARLEKNNEEINCSAKQDKQRWQQQRSKFQQDLRHAQLRQNQLKKLVQQADKKYLLLFGKLSQSQEWRVKLKQFECRNELMQQKSARLENCIQECRCELEAKQREKQQISIRLDKELNNLREYQVQNFRLKEKLKCREQEKNKIANELEAYHNRLKDYERMKIVAEMREKENEAELREERTRVVKLEERQKVRDKQISSLKMKLLRAKIQTIHQIREVIT